jgi:hypothetical protein
MASGRCRTKVEAPIAVAGPQKISKILGLREVLWALEGLDL